MSIAFVINIFNDDHLAKRLIGQIVEHFPGDKIILIPDEDRLKLKPTCEWTERYLKKGLESGADFIIKIDPDSCVWRPFSPPNADWFGSLSNTKDYIRGGCCGFSKSAAKKLVESGQLKKHNPFSYPRYDQFKWPHEKRDPVKVTLQDKAVRLICKELGIKPTSFPEFSILGNGDGIAKQGDYAVTHPHPTL